MSIAAVLIARIRSRERVMANIARRNPDTFRTNQYYSSLNSAVIAYRGELSQLEGAGATRDEFVLNH
ncbi:MAG: hypothetical protein H0V47_08910 [Chloroflexia bacterium]|nr:hypothetical protein [Chloroflexia bacterium]